MKFLFCHNYYQQPGGEDQVFADEAWLLESHGHEVLRYTRHNDDIRAMGRLETVRQTFWSRRTYDELSELICREQPALLHCTNTFPLISPAAYDAARDAGIPVVQSLHNFRLLCPNALMLRDGAACESCLGKIFAWPGVVHGCYRESRVQTATLAAMTAYHKLRRTWVNKVDAFIALADFARDKFIAGGLPGEKIAVKPNFVRPISASGVGRQGRALFVGRLSAEKGIATLLAAWEQMTNPIELMIVGDGPLAGEVQLAAARDPRIRWLGRRPIDEVYQQMAAALCVVLPSVCYENCPKTLLESLAMGTPVVASRLGAMQEYISHERTGLHFPVGDPAALAATVARLHDNPALAQSLGEQAECEYAAKYTPETNYRQLMNIYRRAGAAIDEPKMPDRTDRPMAAVK